MPFGSPRRLPSLLRNAALLAIAGAALAASAPVRAQTETAKPADKLVVVSTCDVKGKTVPCGCHIPKGGLSRRAAFTDSLRKLYPNVLLVDAGGFFPDGSSERDDAPFISGAMHDLGVCAAGVGERELQFGRAFFLATVADAKVPVVCANLLDRKSRSSLVPRSLIVKSGRAKVGLFGLINAQASLGPSADSLEIKDPTAVAREVVADLRKKGATVIVLLSALGKVETEDLALAVPGIDLAVGSRNVPVLQRARMIDKTTVVFGGEQSHYIGVTEFTLDAKGLPTASESGTWTLGPDIADQPAMLARVNAYEARPDVKIRRAPVARPANSDSARTSSQ